MKRRGMSLMLVRRDERGIALVLAMLVMMVVLSLSITIVQLAMTQDRQAARNAKTVIAAQTADTAFANYLVEFPTSGAGLGYIANLCTNWAGAQSIPGAQYPTDYTLGLAFTDTTGASLDCTTYTGSQVLATATITATPSVGLTGKSSANVQREFVMTVDLDPIYGSALDSAIYGSTNVYISGNFDLSTSESSSNIYAGGDLGTSNSCCGFAAGFATEGSLYAQGNIVGLICYCNGDVWAGGNANVTNSCIGTDAANAIHGCPAFGNASDAGSFLAAGNATTKNTVTAWDCAAGGTLTVQNPNYCGYATAVDSQSGSGVPDGHGAVDQYTNATVSAPPTVSFPSLLYANVLSDALAGKPAPPGHTYVRKIFSTCAEAEAAIYSWGSSTGTAWTTGGNILVDIWGQDCQLDLHNTNTIKGDLLILTDGANGFNGSGTWTGTNCTGTTGLCQLSLIHPSNESPAPSCPTIFPSGPWNTGSETGEDYVWFSNNTAFSNINVFVYTPCRVISENNADAGLQVIAGDVFSANHGQFNFKKAYVPGTIPDGYTPTVTGTYENVVS